MATVAILNTHKDTIEFLRYLLETHGFQTVSMDVDRIKEGAVDVIEFLRSHRPDMIIYDVAPPSREAWNFAQLLRHAEPVRDTPFVFTSTNKPLLDKIVGSGESLQLILKPYDFEEVLRAVQEALLRRR